MDCVLSLVGERSQELRILRANKNRFGTTSEIGAFEMAEEGLKEIKNLSAIFLESMGLDPERGDDGQVIREVRFMTQQELAATDNLYPEYLKDELWTVLDRESDSHNPFKIRK